MGGLTIERGKKGTVTPVENVSALFDPKKIDDTKAKIGCLIGFFPRKSPKETYGREANRHF